IARRPFQSGRSTVTRRSKRPGRKSALSSPSGRFVAAITTTAWRVSKPSISTRLRLVLHMILIQQRDQVRVPVGYLRKVIMVRKDAIALGVHQLYSVSQVASDILSLENGILNIPI